MVKITVTIDPGIWRSPHWILEEIDRLARKYRARSVTEAVDRLCRTNAWGWAAAPIEGGLIVSLHPLRPRAQVIDGVINLAIPAFLTERPADALPTAVRMQLAEPL